MPILEKAKKLLGLNKVYDDTLPPVEIPDKGVKNSIARFLYIRGGRNFSGEKVKIENVFAHFLVSCGYPKDEDYEVIKVYKEDGTRDYFYSFGILLKNSGRIIKTNIYSSIHSITIVDGNTTKSYSYYFIPSNDYPFGRVEERSTKVYDPKTNTTVEASGFSFKIKGKDSKDIEIMLSGKNKKESMDYKKIRNLIIEKLLLVGTSKNIDELYDYIHSFLDDSFEISKILIDISDLEENSRVITNRIIVENGKIAEIIITKDNKKITVKDGKLWSYCINGSSEVRIEDKIISDKVDNSFVLPESGYDNVSNEIKDTLKLTFGRMKKQQAQQPNN